MKKLLVLLLAAALLLPCAAPAEGDGAPEILAAAIGEAEFNFTNEQEYFDLVYRYPDEFSLEIQEEPDRVRHVLRWLPEEYIKPAVGLVVSRTKSYATAKERLEDISFIDQITTEEINGVTWTVGTDSSPSNTSVTIWAREAGGYVYTFSFSSDFPEDFDFGEFAAVFARGVK